MQAWERLTDGKSNIFEWRPPSSQTDACMPEQRVLAAGAPPRDLSQNTLDSQATTAGHEAGSRYVQGQVQLEGSAHVRKSLVDWCLQKPQRGNDAVSKESICCAATHFAL